jgi:6-phosphogluconolactonase
LYGSNRGHDSIAMFSVDEETGRLSLIGHEPTQGRTPRNFAIDPTGAFLLVANQDSNSIVVFRIDAATGRLDATGHSIEVPAPVCIRFAPQ